MQIYNHLHRVYDRRPKFQRLILDQMEYEFRKKLMGDFFNTYLKRILVSQLNSTSCKLND